MRRPTSALRSETPPQRQRQRAVPRHVRALTAGWGGFMIAMAGVNAWLGASGRSELYVGFAETAYVDLYREAFETLVAPHPLPWVLALVAFEAGVGAATLAPGRARTIGLGASAAFVLALTPSNAFTLGNPALAALPAYLLARHLRSQPAPRLAD